MRKLISVPSIFTLLTLSACSQNTETIESQIELYEQQIENYEMMSDYYNSLCDVYGYQTYDMIYYPEKWKYYISEGIVHTDWLCSHFDHNAEYCQSASSSLFEELSLCECCQNEDIYFLDVDEKLFHASKAHLNLGTEDFIHPNVNYRLVSYESAIAANFTPCECCSVDDIQ